MSVQKFWSKENSGIAVRGLGTYILCQGIFYFYDKTVAGGAETRQLGIVPYIVITLWFAWIFFHNRVLLRKLAFRKKLVSYILALAAGITLVAAVQQQLVAMVRGMSNPISGIMVSITYYTLIGVIIFLAFEYLRERKIFYQTKTLMKEVELQQLKNQLNPHFLFNSLNNIYSYNLENNTYGNDLILKLSQLMRFMVESAQQDTIVLKEEIGFIDNYIAFETERLGYRCDIQYEKNLAFAEKSIPPLLLFPFIENAFKHGSNTISQSRIRIKIEDSEDGLALMVRNDVIVNNKHSTKTGLSNVGRRLELLYPGRHELKIQQEKNEYIVNLKLKLE